MSGKSPFFVSDEDDIKSENKATLKVTKLPEVPSSRLKVPSKFVKKWSDYVDDAAVQNSVGAVNGEVSFSLPIVRVDLSQLLKINIDMVYMTTKDGVECEIPLAKNFISVDHQKSVFKNDEIFYMNSMGSKMTFESVGVNKFKVVEDEKGEIDATYFQTQEYFVVESELEKFIYGKYGSTGTVLYELTYKNWRETGNDPENLIKIPVAWYLAERHSKADGRSIYYHYENVEEQHKLNPKVSYTSEVMLKSIDDGNEVKVEFEYGVKESSENEERKLKNDDGNLRMGNFLMEKHFLKRIKVETEKYEQDFGISYDLFNKETRNLKAISQVMFDGKSEEVLSIKNQKILSKFLPSEIGVFHGVTTKFTYEDQIIPSPLLQKKFLLKNRPAVSYGNGILAFSSLVDNRMILKIFDIKTFKLVKEFSIIDQKTITEDSLQVSFGQNFMVVSYKTDEAHNLKIYHGTDPQKWEDTPTAFNYSKDAKVYTTGRDFVVVQDSLTIDVIQKMWSEKKWIKHSFQTGDKDPKIFINGKSIFVLERSNLLAIYKAADGVWNSKQIKSGLTYTAEKIGDLFDVNDDIRDYIIKPLQNDEIKVMKNVVILSNLNFSDGQFKIGFKFLTIGDGYEIEKEENFIEDREKISNIEKRFEAEDSTLITKYAKSGDKYIIQVFDFEGEILKEINKEKNPKKREKLRQAYRDAFNNDEEFQKSMKGQFLLDWKKYYPMLEGGKNDMFFSEDIQFRMTGSKWTKNSLDKKREVKLGEYFELIFDNDHPEVVKLVSQKDENVKIDLILHQPNMMVNLYPHYIAYQSAKDVTKIIVFDEGKSILKQETFMKEELMFESSHGYFMTIKKSEDSSHSEPYELIIRNMAQFIPDKPQPVVQMTEMWKDFKDWPQPEVKGLRNVRNSRNIQRRVSTGSQDTRVTKYERSFKGDKKLWTAVVKMMNGYTTDESGWVEYYVTRNDEADIEQVTSYYGNDKKLLKSEKKEEGETDDQDYSDNLLYDASGTLQISNFIPYKKSEDAFGYLGFEDYEEITGWTFYPKNVIKNGYALTGRNYLRLSKDDTIEKSFIPQNKEEIFIAAAWMRSIGLKIGDRLENFKALVSFSPGGKKFTELFGILGDVKYTSGEWCSVEVTIDFPNLIRMSYNDYRAEHPGNPEFEAVDFKITLLASGTEKSEADIDNIAFYPAAHQLDVNVYNDNHGVTAAIHNEGQITRIFYDSKSFKEIGRTKKNGKLEQLLVRSENERDSPKIVTKFTLSSGFHENFDVNLFPERWSLGNEQNFKVMPSELVHTKEDSYGKLEVKDEKIMDEKSAVLRLEVSLDSDESSNFEVNFKTDSIEFESVGKNSAQMLVNGKKVVEIPRNFELTFFKYQKRTIVWIDGVIKFDEVLKDAWKGFSLNFNGKLSVKDFFVINNPKIEVFYHNSFDEKQQEIKFESENTAIVTQYIYDPYGHEIVKTKPTKVTKSSTESLLKFHRNFIKSFDPQTGKMEGDVVTENPGDEGFPYQHTTFHKNPLNEKQKVGQPGKQFSLHSDFATSYDKTIDFPFLNAYFPDNQGFTKSVQNLANGSKTVLVFNKDGHKVAKYVQVPNFDDILTTLEVDSEGRILKILPPEYHVAANTMSRTNTVYTPGDDHLSDEEKKLQGELGIHQKYDERGNIVELRSPDVGRQEFVYNSLNLLKFSITHNADPDDGQTIYYNYDSAGTLTETGYITRPVSTAYLAKFTESNFHTQAVEFQKIQFNEGKSKTIETINHESVVLEEVEFDENEEDKIVSRKLTVPILTDTLETTFEVQRKYDGDNVEVLTYPTTDDGKILKVKHTYDGVGQLIGIGTAEKPFCFAKFTYDANGQPTSEVHELNNLNRKYGYNSPGYMNKIEDEFLTEDISYIDGGYGQLGYGDGIVMKTAYNAKWSKKFFGRDGDGSDSDYDGGAREEDSEENLRNRRNKLRNLKKKNLQKVRVEDKNQEVDRHNSDSDENRRKREIEPDLFSNNEGSFNGKFEDSHEKLRLRKIREYLLKKFNGYSTNINNHLSNGRNEIKEADFNIKSEKVDESNNNEDFSSNQPNKSIKKSSIGSEAQNEPNSTQNHESVNNVKDNLQIHEKVDIQDNTTTADEVESSNRHKRSSNPKEDDERSAYSNRDAKIAEIIANPDKDACIKALRKAGIVSQNSLKFSRVINTNEEVDLPLKCYDSKIYDEISAKFQVPSYYGHRFTYGNHRELVKAKYFSTKDEEEVDPLMMHTFSDRMADITLYKSHNIFNTLREGNFIAVDQLRDDKKSSIATRGATSLLRDDDLNKLLDQLSEKEEYDFHEVFSVTKQLIFHTIGNKKILSYSDFEKIFLKWKNAASGVFPGELEKLKRRAKMLYDGLVQQQLLPTSSDTFITPISKKLVTDLKKYEQSQILEIVTIVSKIFNNQILETAFDITSYEIDANGNHKKFSTGFDNVKLDYHKNTSKLSNLNIKGEEFEVTHDGYGNMTSAPHKGVKRIIYHPVSRRVMEVLLTNGGSIKFHYNSQGERILKQTFNEKYKITNEVFYVRDEDGNVLMDRVMKFNQEDKTCFEIVTHYIYGPRGMIGFIRDDKFHSVFTDHSGSVRLVIRDGEVVAAYDYLPYGEMMRKFVADESADIRYLYQGKELDEETSIYNFQARFYDPTIGRFLQTDPQSQYFSPYKFSGNSPVSFIDPDGEFAFLIALTFAAVGAYLAAAAHNKSWNPAKWNFKDPGTWLSLGMGALTGYFLPGGIAASFAAFGYVVTPVILSVTAYVSVSVANKSWDPADWNFSDPGTFSAIFDGIAAGASILKGVASFKSFAKTLTSAGKIKLYIFSGVTAGSAFYLTGIDLNGGNAKFWQWDFTSPEIYQGILDGFKLGLSTPIIVIEFGRDLKGLMKDAKQVKEFFKTMKLKDIRNLKAVFADPNHPLSKFLHSAGFGFLLKNGGNKDFIPVNFKSNAGSYGFIMKSMASGQNFSKASILMDIKKVVTKAAEEFKKIKAVVKFVKMEYTMFKEVLISMKNKNNEQYTRYIVKNGQVTDFLDAMQDRIKELGDDINNENVNLARSIIRDSQIFFDRVTRLLNPCEGTMDENGICRSFRMNWNAVKDSFSRVNINTVFENTAILSEMPSEEITKMGYVTLSGPGSSSNGPLVQPGDIGTLAFADKPSIGSKPGLVAVNRTVVEVEISDGQKRGYSPVSIVMTDQVPGTAIYIREEAGKLKIYHQYREPESKIALTTVKNSTATFYDTKEGTKIEELSGVDVQRLFDSNNDEIKLKRGAFEIPDDGVVKYIKDGEFKVLKSINDVSVEEIARRNKEIQQKNAETLNLKLPNFNENCDTCKAIHWEDHLPVGVIDTSYNLDIAKQLKATVVIYKDDLNNWKLSSQLIQYNKEKGGTLEIADIRPRPKIFDLKLGEKKEKKKEKSHSRKPRNVEFIPESAKVPSTNFHFINNSTQNFNRSTPSVLQLGDFWLNATDFNSNLTLAYAFLKKWTNETLFSTNEGNMPKITEIEFEIFAHDLLEEFTENVTKFSIKCGISKVMREILDETNLLKISKEVKRKCEKNLTEEIPKYLMMEIVEKNERKIVGKSSKKQFEKLKRMTSENLQKFADDLNERNNKLWNQN